MDQIVLVDYEDIEHNPPTKQHPNKMGPFKIIGKRDNVYTTENCATGKIEDFHVTLIHPFLYDEHEVDPGEVAMHDDELRIIEEVTDHRFIGNGKAFKDNLELKIRFEDDRSTEWNSWIKEYNSITLIQDYFRKVGLTKFILPQYR